VHKNIAVSSNVYAEGASGFDTSTTASSERLATTS
jgi:hypothetical protein